MNHVTQSPKEAAMGQDFELAIGDASKALGEAMVAAAEKAGISLVTAEGWVHPGDGGCTRFTGPTDVYGTTCPFVIDNGDLNSDGIMPMVATMFARDVAKWVDGLAASGKKTITYARPPAVLTCGLAPYKKAIWLLYAAVA